MMPTPYIEKVAQKYGKPVDDVERIWDKAKSAVGDEHKDDYALITHIFQKMVKSEYA
jgi:hypothetical protein